LDTDSVIGLARVYPEPVDVPDDEVEPELQNDDNVSIRFIYPMIDLSC